MTDDEPGGEGSTGGEADGDAAYVLRVQFRLDAPGGLRVDPARFETVVEREAAPPGDAAADWLFFRDHLWRGAVNDEPHVRRLVAEALGGYTDGSGAAAGDGASGLVIESVSFSELRTDPSYLDALEAAIERELDAGTGTFGNADSVDEVLKNHLGSSIHVRPAPDERDG